MVSLALKISLVFVVVVGETKLLIYGLRRLQGVIMFGYLRCLLGHQRSVYNNRLDRTPATFLLPSDKGEIISRISKGNQICSKTTKKKAVLEGY